MYRIEVDSGEETVFRTIEELAVGIRNGVVTPRARIYHNASQKWLPIGLHPHYKKALDMPAASAPHAPVTATTPLPKSSRAKTHPVSHPKPTPEPEPVPMTAPAPKAPAPVRSPVIAMQDEVLRDLPVISIPEPLPWTVKPSPPSAPAVQVHAPAVEAPAASAPAVQAPAVHARVTQAPATHAPVTYAPVVHTPVTHAPVTHAPTPHAPASHAPRELAPPVGEPRDTDADELLPIFRPTARRSRRMSGRPFLLLGAAAALVVGTHLVLTATPSASADPSVPPPSVSEADAPESPSPPPASETDQLAPGIGSTGTRSDGTPVREAPQVTIAPARVSMTPGPAFAGSVPTRPGADSAGKPAVAIQAPTPEPVPAALLIAPAPAAIDLALPGLPPDSILPTTRTGDTMGMKKILRALNGPQPAGVSATP